MSSCLHRLLLFRLRTSSPSFLPKQRLRSELNQLQRLSGVRSFSRNVSRSNTAGANEVYNDSARRPWPLGSVSDAKAQIPENVHDISPLSDPSYQVQFHPSHQVRSPYNSRIWHYQVGWLDYTRYTQEGRRFVTRRFVSHEMLAKDRSIKEKSLSKKSSDVIEWRKACRKIYDRRSQGVGLQLDANDLDLGGDPTLLEPLKRGRMEDFRCKWSALEKHQKADLWPRFSLWLLSYSPGLVPSFLKSTCGDKYKPVFVMVSDCIYHLIHFFPHLADQTLITECLRPQHWPVLVLPQQPVRWYILKAEHNNVKFAFKLAFKRRVHMESATILCFMKRFTDFGDVENALEAFRLFRKMSNSKVSLKSGPALRHCCKLLTLDSIVDNEGGRNFRILPRLLQLGAIPNRELMNVVLSNAFKSGDSQVAQEIVNYMREQKLEPDAYTYLALLTDAVRVGDHDHLSRLLQEIEVREEVRRNPWILSKILHSHLLSIGKGNNFEGNANEIFYSMLAMYNRLHDITPLKELSIVPPHYMPSVESEGQSPNVVALYIMIATYLRCPQNIVNRESVYSRFRQLVLQNHPSIAPLAATDHTYNEFLVAFRADFRGLRPAVRLVEDMLHSSSFKAEEKHQKNEIEHVPPTARTWAILLSCFVFNKQALAAEKVRAMMARYGVRYNIDVWNMIINNYANTNDIHALARSIKQMERDGIVADNYTLNPLRFLRDPERLWVALDELDRASDEYYHVKRSQEVGMEEEEEDYDDLAFA